MIVTDNTIREFRRRPLKRDGRIGQTRDIYNKVLNIGR